MIGSSLVRELKATVLAFWRWWIGELVATISPRLQRWVTGGGERPVVFVEAGEAVFFLDDSRRRTWLGSIDLAAAPADEVRRSLTPPQGRPLTERRDLTVELPAHAALRRVTALPTAAEGNLAEVVGFEIDRHSPFKRADACHAFRVLRRDRAARRIFIELTVVPRVVVESTLAQLRRFGLEPMAVIVAGDGLAMPASTNLLPQQGGPRSARLPRLVLATLASIAFVLAGVAVALPDYRAEREMARLTVALGNAKRQADESRHLQQTIDAALHADGFLVARKRQIFSASRLLDTLTNLLPDDTWLTELRVAGTDVQIAGLGASASSVIALIDQTAGFSDAGFRSPVTQDPQIKREQFDIGARLDGASSQ